MKPSFRVAAMSAAIMLTLSGCVSLSDINAGFRKLDRAWLLEYQKSEDEHRYRVVDAQYAQVFTAVQKSFLELGLPVEVRDYASGRMVASNTAPAPLSLEEWKTVAQKETPRMKEIAGSLFYLAEDPKDYVVTVLARVKQLEPGKTLVVLDYELDAPKYRAMGVEPSKTAPPSAVQLASLKFWRALQSELDKVKAPPPRRRTPGEWQTDA